MKIILTILLFLFPAILYSQDEENDYSKHGLFGEFEGGSLNQIGYRYRFSLSNSIAFSIKAHLFEYDSKSSKYNYRNTHQWKIKSIYEYSVYQANSARCFLSMGLGYSISASERTETENVYINSSFSHSYDYVIHNYINTLIVVAGIGGEYYISKNMSVFIHQNIEMESTKDSDKSNIYSFESKSTEKNIADTKLGLTIYF